MDSTFKILGFGASVIICSLMAGCSEGTDPAGTGGSSGTTGGSSGTTGGASAGGATGGAGTSAAKLFTFDMDEQGWKLSDVAGTVPYTNLVKPVVEPVPTLNQVSTKDAGSDPASGSLKITANFTFWNQSVAAEVAAPQDSNGVPVDFTGKTVTARIFIEPMGISPFGFGDTADAPGGVVFYMKSGTTYDWGQAAWFNATTYGSWFSVKFNTANLDSGSKAEFDPSNVVQIGLSFSSGGGGAHCPDDAAADPNHAAYMGKPTATCPAWAAPLPTVIYIDSITVAPN